MKWRARRAGSKSAWYPKVPSISSCRPVRSLDLPVARHEDLAVEHPLTRGAQGGVIRRHAALHERVHGQARVPHGGGTGLVVDLVVRLDGEGLDLLELARLERVVVGIAE